MLQALRNFSRLIFTGVSTNTKWLSDMPKLKRIEDRASETLFPRVIELLSAVRHTPVHIGGLEPLGTRELHNHLGLLDGIRVV